MAGWGAIRADPVPVQTTCTKADVLSENVTLLAPFYSGALSGQSERPVSEPANHRSGGRAKSCAKPSSACSHNTDGNNYKTCKEIKKLSKASFSAEMPPYRLYLDDFDI